MGFLTPRLAPFDLHFWHWGRRSERLKPLCEHWGEHGPGIPTGVYLLHTSKIAAFLAGGLFFIGSTPGLGAFEQVGTWWTQPVVFQKAIVWSLLFEVLGLGSGFGPLAVRFVPPLGGVLHWLRPGTIRLPPWPSRIPFTRGTRRGYVDVLLYLALLVACGWLLLSPATAVVTGLTGSVSMLDPMRILPVAVLVPLLGLRDKTIFLAARSEHYWITMLTFLLPFVDMIVAAKVLLVLLWWGAATSKLTRAFPFTAATMLSNAPLVPSWVSRRLFRSFPEDMRPSRLSNIIAWTVTMIEFVVPMVLLVSTNRATVLAAIAVMATYLLCSVVSMPFGVPLEWNLILIFSGIYLFWGHLGWNVGSAAHPALVALLVVPVVALIVWGNVRPDQVSYLVAMRYYAGNWASSMWAMTPSAVAKIDANVVKSSTFAKQQLARLYGEQNAEFFAHKVFTFRALHHHGRALFGLLPRAAGSEHEDAFVIDGELVAGAVLGWNFGDGHMQDEQLITALRQRCDFEPGEVRVVLLESQPIGSGRQEYRLVDGATGVFERGYVLVDDMVTLQPWEIDAFPVHVVSRHVLAPEKSLLDEADERRSAHHH